MRTSVREIEVSAEWLPDGVELDVYEFTTCKAERKMFRKRSRIKPSVWAERHRILPDDSALPGPWRNDSAPYVTGILDGSDFPGVQVVIWCAAPQVGKTEAVNTKLGHTIDRDPGPVMLVYPDQKTAKHNIDKRINEGLINTSPRLSSYKTGDEDDMSKSGTTLQHMAIHLAWAKSPSSLANKPIKTIIFDEVDKYPTVSSKKEAGPIALGEKRTRTYKWTRKIFKISSPTIETGQIWMALNNEAQVVFHYFVKCPKCGHMQLMQFDQFKWPENVRDPERIETVEELVHYECEFSGCQWDDQDRDDAVAGGEWRDLVSGAELFAYLREHRPRKIGFHTPAWLSRFVTLAECVASFLKGQKDIGGSEWKENLKDFMNGYKAEPWQDYTVERDEDRIKKLKDERPMGVVPSGGVVAGITAAVDTQDNGFFYEIRAWGYGLQRESWQIRSGFVTTFASLDEILWDEELADVDGNQYRIELAVIDSGGHRTSAVYDWARTRRGRVFAYKGERTMSKPHDFSMLDFYPPDKKGRRKPIPGGLKLLKADSKLYKDRLSTLLEVSHADPGAWHLNSETSSDWCKQMTVEYVDDNGFWQCPEHKANHAWDCSYMNLVAAAVKRIEFRKRSTVKTKAKATPKPAPSLGGWVETSDDWLGE